MNKIQIIIEVFKYLFVFFILSIVAIREFLNSLFKSKYGAKSKLILSRLL